MAGERKGKTYEAIVFVVLSKLKKEGKLKGNIFWNETPKTMTIEPDLVVGDQLDKPDYIFMVTHGGSAKESNRKYWRNVGELVEEKTRLRSVPKVLAITFDSIIKEDIKRAEQYTLDGALFVGDVNYGVDLQAWVDNNQEDLPTKVEDKANEITKLLGADKELKRNVEKLSRDIKSLLVVSSPELDKLWLAERSRVPTMAPKARETCVRRGFTKACLLGEIPTTTSKTMKKASSWSIDIGLVQKVLGGYRVVDPDLQWIAKSPLRSIDIKALINGAATEGFRKQIEKIYYVEILEQYTRYIINHLDELISTSGMKKHLQLMELKPAVGLSLPEGVPGPANIWLFDFIGALTKAKNKKAQGFGYSDFAKHKKAKETKIGNMDIGVWVSCFMNQYFSRKSDFNPPIAAVDYVAEVLSETLTQFSKKEITDLTSETKDRYVAKEYEATLLAHRGFDPIGWIVSNGLVGHKLTATSVRSAFAERAGLAGASGKTSLLKVDQTFVKWQSVTDAGRDHKKKELCGRAVGLRYTWDPRTNKFIDRPGVKKLILVLDGTWRQDDLDALCRAGWDEIFYPDEIDKLAKAIV
jgi:hypothetical protein